MNWNLEMLVFEERGKPEYPEKILSEQGREPTTNSTHIIMTPGPGVEPGRPHWWEASALTTAPSLLPLKWLDFAWLTENDHTGLRNHIIMWNSKQI